MTDIRASSIALATAAAMNLSACDRGAPPVEATRSTVSTVQPTRSPDAASTPLPVSPSGLSNSSTAQQGNDLSNSTSASGKSNMYEPSSASAPPAQGVAVGNSADHPSAASQSVSSQTSGTHPPANDGTLPKGTEGSTGARRGGGKS